MARKNRESETLKKARSASHGSLSDEERALWEHAARDLKPLKDKPQRVLARTEEPAPARPHAAHPASPKREPERRPAESARSHTERSAPPLSDLDRRKTRRVGSGKVEIEGRIDLHGMRQSEAHAALHRFLRSAHAQDKRWVLIITGKGAPLDRSLSRMMAPADETEIGGEQRGVLRRNVPRWLAEPELRSIVVGYSSAAIRHGGEGALYVQLRKRRAD
jgi:DNA-nicking Smr family endonuclease